MSWTCQLATCVARTWALERCQRRAVADGGAADLDVVDIPATVVDAAITDVPEAEQDRLAGVRRQVEGLRGDVGGVTVQCRPERPGDGVGIGERSGGLAAVGRHHGVRVVVAQLREVLLGEGQRRRPRGDGDRGDRRRVQVGGVARPQRRVAGAAWCVADTGPEQWERREGRRTAEGHVLELPPAQEAGAVAAQAHVVGAARGGAGLGVRGRVEQVDRGTEALGGDGALADTGDGAAGGAPDVAVHQVHRLEVVQDVDDPGALGEDVELRLDAGEALLLAVAVQRGDERLAVAVEQEQLEGPGIAVVGEDLAVAALIPPQRQGVLRTAAVTSAAVGGGDRVEALEAGDVTLGAALGDRLLRLAVAGQRDREVRQALVDEVHLGRVLVGLQPVLVLVGEHALIQPRAGRAAAARVCRGLVRWVDTGAVLPVEGVDRHHVAVHQELNCDEKKPAMYVVIPGTTVVDGKRSEAEEPTCRSTCCGSPGPMGISCAVSRRTPALSESRPAPVRPCGRRAPPAWLRRPAARRAGVGRHSRTAAG